MIADVRCPLGPGQLQLWVEYQRNPASSAYHIGRALRLATELNPTALRTAFERLLERHMWLRSTVEVGTGTPLLRHRPDAPVPFVEVDAAHWSEEQLHAKVAEAFNAPFDLIRDPPIRVVLYRISAADWALVFAVHHIAVDFRSIDVLARDWVSLYEGKELGAAPASYPDYVRWHEQRLRSADRHRSYWEEQLRTASDSPRWPLGRPLLAPAVRAIRKTRRLDPDLMRQLDELARREHVTRFTLFLAVFQALIFRYTGESDVCVGVPVSLRPAAFRDTLGYCVNTTIVRSEPAAETAFVEFLRDVRATVIAAFRSAVWPLSRVSRLSGADLFRTMFVDYGTRERDALPSVLDGTGTTQRWGAWPVTDIGIDRATPYDVMLSIADHGGATFCALECDAARFEDSAMERLLGHFETLLRSVVAAPTSRLRKLPMLTGAELRQLDAWNETSVTWEEPHVLHKLVAQQVRRTPDAIAVVTEDRRWTFREIDDAAAALARAVIASGGGPGQRVAVLLDPGAGMVIALLGILKAGSAFAPLHAEDGDARIGAILEHLQPALVVTAAALRHRIAASASVVCVDGLPSVETSTALPRVSPDALAYILYTSGSTGHPKGVMMSHRAICNRLLWMRDQYPLRPDDCVFAKTPYVFDVSLWELFLPLIGGFRMLLPRPGGHRDPAYLVRLICGEGVTIAHFVPSMLRVLLDEPGLEDCGSLARVFVSGEALPAALRDLFFRRLGAELHNLYGPTEAAVDVTFWDCDADRARDPVPIGHPIANVQLFVVDAEGNRLPVEVTGELCIAGAALADGYWRDPLLTEAQFVRRTVSGRDVRMYRTGDAVRYRDDGSVEFLGRLDDQVKVSGMRVEPGEIEEVLRQHPAVADCIVLPLFAKSGVRLAAYVIPRGAATERDLRSFLSARLPAPFMPAIFSLLDAWPRTATGKVDRKALPAPALAPAAVPGMAPAEAESVLIALWSEVLGTGVALDDDFFQLGGDSLRALQVRARARDLGYDFSVQDFFDAPTVHALATRVKPAVPEPTTYAAFSQISDDVRRNLAPDVEDAYPLTKLQEALVFHSSMGPDYETYVLSIRVRMRYEERALRESLATLSASHEMLRVGYALTSDFDYIQCVHRSAPVPLETHDLSALAEAEQDARIRLYIEEERGRRFDWMAAPLLRMRVDVRGLDVVQLTVSHPLYDGWSLATFLVELLEEHLRRVDGRPPAPMTRPRSSYGEFVALERDALASPEAREYWTQIVASAPSSSLPRRGDMDIPRRARQTLPLDANLGEELRRLAHSLRLPLKSVLLAAHLEIVKQLTGRSDVMTGLITNGRIEERDGHRVVGLFLNTIPLRVESGWETWAELAGALFAAEQQAWPYRRFPFAQIVALAGRMPVDTAFNYIHFHLFNRIKTRPGIEVVDWINPSDLTYFPMCAYFNDDPISSVLLGYLDYDLRYLTGEQAEGIARDYGVALRDMVANPDGKHRAGVTPTQRAEVRRPSISVVRQIAQQVACRSGMPAVRQGNQMLTYGELDQRARRLAGALRLRGAGRDVPVGVRLDRSPETVVALLGVLQAGACFVPIAPDSTPDRMAALVADCGLRMMVEGFDEETGADIEVVVDPDPDTLAYIIYTSGSTGEPKGVEVPHRALVNTLAAVGREIGITAADRWLAVTSLSFDIAILELLLPLCAGACVWIADPEQVRDGRRLAAAVEESGATFVQATPSMWRLLTESGWLGSRTTRALCGGEALSRALADRLLQLTAKVWNLYGPTEATIWCTIAEVEAGNGQPPIGRPIENTTAQVLGPDLSPLPSGTPGELWIGGVGLARGYRNRPELTRERFVADPFSGAADARVYRTGDRALVRSDGAIEFLGRIDTQVKVRGFRVELGAIETLLRKRADVGEVVVVTSAADYDARLTAYLRATGGPGPSAGELRWYLARHLPPYMIPSEFVVVESFPMTRNGKIDREALARLPPVARAAEEMAPPGRIADLVRIFSEVLHVSLVSPDDSFFLLGGHSLLAMRACARVEQELGTLVPVHLLFEFPTPRALASRLQSSAADAHRERSAPPRRTREIERMALRRRQTWMQEDREPE